MSEFIGRSCCCSGRVRAFRKYLQGCQDYIETGTLFGGSAVEIGQIVSGDVHCVDPLNGYNGEPGRPDPECDMVPSPEIVRSNWEAAGLDPLRLHLHLQKTPPLPVALGDRKFDVAYIDGDHTVEGCMSDWLLLKDRISKFIIFDDLDNKPAVRHVVQVAVGSTGSDWRLIDHDFLGILAHV